MQIYDGNLLHILKPMTRKTWGEGAVEGDDSTLFHRERNRERSKRIIALDPVISIYTRRHSIDSPMIGVR